MVVAALVGFAAVAHATWNVVLKKTGASGVGFLWLTFAVGAVVFAPFGVSSLIDNRVDLGRWFPLVVVSGALQVGYFLLLQRAYRVADVSIVYPLARGTGPLLTVLLAIAVFGERPSTLVLGGVVLIVVGVVTIGLAGGRGSAALNRPGVVYGLLVGVVIAAYTMWDAAAVTVGGMPPVGLYWGSVVFQLLLLAVPAVRGFAQTRDAARHHWVAAIVVGVLAPLAYILILMAMQLAPVSIVAPAREVSVVLVGIAGWLVFKELNPVQRLVGGTIVLLGVALLAVG